MEEELTPKEEHKRKNPLFEGFKHGISKERLENPPEYILCSLCNKIYWNPQECGNHDCKSAFCSPCLENSLKLEEKCPKCKNSPKFEPARFLVMHMLTHQKFRCINHPACQISGIKYDDLPYHMCEFDILECPIESCTWNGNRKDLEEHVNNCLFQILFCPNKRLGCAQELRKGDMEEHLNECNYQEIGCSAQCGVKGLRGWIEEHLNSSCPYYLLECKYKHRGCTSEPQRQDFHEHIRFCDFKPVMLDCGHTVGLSQGEIHATGCPLFPLRCTKCAHLMTRQEMGAHQCIPYLLHKINILERGPNSQSQKHENSVCLDRKEKERNLELIQSQIAETNQLKTIIHGQTNQLNELHKKLVIEQEKNEHMTGLINKKFEEKHYSSEKLEQCYICKSKYPQNIIKCQNCNDYICINCDKQEESIKCEKCNNYICKNCQNTQIEKYCIPCKNISQNLNKKVPIIEKYAGKNTNRQEESKEIRDQASRTHQSSNLNLNAKYFVPGISNIIQLNKSDQDDKEMDPSLMGGKEEEAKRKNKITKLESYYRNIGVEKCFEYTPEAMRSIRGLAPCTLIPLSINEFMKRKEKNTFIQVEDQRSKKYKKKKMHK